MRQRPHFVEARVKHAEEVVVVASEDDVQLLSGTISTSTQTKTRCFETRGVTM